MYNSRLRGGAIRAAAVFCLFTAAPSMVSLAHGAQGEQTITIHAKKYAFVPSAITLKKGDPVKIVLLSDDTPHGLAVPGLALHLDAAKDHPAEAVVTPNTTGDFAGKCSRFCGPGHRDMKFNVHVTE